MRSKHITQMGLMLATALVLSYLETLLPVVVAVPGVKIGLANMITMLFLYQYGAGKAFAFMIVRVVLSGVLFSGVAGIIYSMAGGICFVGSLVLILYSLVQYFRGHAVEGYTTTILVMLLIGSAIMLSLGIIGFYIARIYEEVRRRPRYIVSGIIKGNAGETNDKK